MLKSYKLIDPEQCSSRKGTDGDKCCLCQKTIKESLQCPAKSKHHDIRVGQGYCTICTNILRFSELNALLMAIDLQCLDEGNGLEITLTNNQAVRHKSCSNKFIATKLKNRKKKMLHNR